MYTFRFSVTAAVLLLAATAEAQMRLNASNQTQTIDCKGGSVEVLGSANRLTLVGECRAVEVTGSDNVVTVEAVERIALSGERNRVAWRRVLGDRLEPRVSTLGGGNRVVKAADEPVKAGTAGTPGTSAPATAPARRAAAPAKAAPKAPAAEPAAPAARAAEKRALSSAWSVEGNTLRLAGNSHRETIDCEGRGVVILGNSNRVVLRGECASVSVPGTSNVVEVDSVARIQVQGNNNEIAWTRAGGDAREPRIEDFGRKNVIRQAPR